MEIIDFIDQFGANSKVGKLEFGFHDNNEINEHVLQMISEKYLNVF